MKRLAAVAGVAVALRGILALEIGHSPAVLWLAAGFYASASLLAFRLPGLRVQAPCLRGGASSECGRLAFQWLMQRWRPGGAQGGVFVRYAVLFQMAWVVGAFVPSVVPFPFRTGILVLLAFYVALGIAFLVWPRLPHQ